MALDETSRLPVLATITEALTLTWALRWPYLILAVLFTLPNMASAELGLFESLAAFNAQMQSGEASEVVGELPLGETFLALVLGFAVLSGFGIFWYRYLLLGREGALKFGFAELNGMIWRFTGYGFMVMFVGIIVMTVATLVGCLMGALVSRLLGQSGSALSYGIQFAFVVMAYVWPLNFAARVALIFPAIALGRPIALSEAWLASKNSAGNLVWAILIAGLIFVLLSAGVHSALSWALGVDLMAGPLVAKGAFWWVDILLAPVASLAPAVLLAIVAVAYRELVEGRPAPVAAVDARYAL